MGTQIFAAVTLAAFGGKFSSNEVSFFATQC